jgi:hypothetical protein
MQAPVQASAASSTHVIRSGAARSTMRLLSDPKIATRNAEKTPTRIPARIASGVPPTTSATPGKATMPMISSRGSNDRFAIQGSTIAMKIGATPMQLAATDALDSFIAP